jgi:hypothetical protein
MAGKPAVDVVREIDGSRSGPGDPENTWYGYKVCPDLLDRLLPVPAHRWSGR